MFPMKSFGITSSLFDCSRNAEHKEPAQSLVLGEIRNPPFLFSGPRVRELAPETLPLAPTEPVLLLETHPREWTRECTLSGMNVDTEARRRVYSFVFRASQNELLTQDTK
jgi:hypothetical protein